MKLPQFTIRDLLLSTVLIGLDLAILKVYLLLNMGVGSFGDAFFKIIFGTIAIAAAFVVLRK